jgi:predicted nucleic acid-binding protein
MIIKKQGVSKTMVLVDSSVLINYFKGKNGKKTNLFDTILSQDIPFGISAYTYQELLQGARDNKEFSTLKEYLSSQKIYLLPETIETYEAAAKLYYNARRKGVTPSSLDILIAYSCIYYDLFLLHDDSDYDALAQIFKELKIYKHSDQIP